MVEQYKLSQVAAHNTKNDCWLMIHNKVYDVTKFLSEHPGGEEVLLDVAGTESTDAFEDVGHSNDARDMLVDYLIGDVHDDDKRKDAPKVGNFVWQPEDRKNGKENNTTIILVAAAVALIIGIGVKFAL